MQTMSVSNINFGSKVYYISQQARNDASALLKLMKKSTEYKMNSSQNCWQSKILSSISMAKDIKFSNARLFISAANKSELSSLPDCTLEIGKNILNINSKTGEVISHKMSMFSSLKGLVKKADIHLRKFLQDFNNSKVVTKNTFEIEGYVELK